MSSSAAITIRNNPRDLDKLNGLIMDYSRCHGIPGAIASELMLVCEEIIVNTIDYGYPEGGIHAIEVRLEQRLGQVIVEIRDDAAPFNPLAQEVPDLGLDSDKAPIGGLGLPLVMGLTDEQEYRRVDQQNVMIIRRNILVQ